MSKKDLEMIAGTIKSLKPAGPDLSVAQVGYRNAWQDIAGAFATELAGTNPNFDRARFLTACGCGEELKPAKGGRS